MGEDSKSIGEEGESRVRIFLERMGWQPLGPAFDLDCEHPELHKSSKNSAPRKSHGIDFSFSYVCPIVPDCRRNILVSVKNSSDEQTETRRSLIRSNLNDLATALKCFKRSQEKRAMNQGGGATTSEDIGLLIKINKSDEAEKSYLGPEGPENIEVESSDAVYYLENGRFDFLNKVLDHADSFASSQKQSFQLTKTSLNVSASTRKLTSELLPIQHLIGGPIGIRLESKEHGSEKSSLVIYSEQPVSVDRFKRLASLGLELSSNWVNVYIAFPDYLKTSHEKMIQAALMGLAQRDFAQKVKCISTDMRARFNDIENQSI